MASEITISKIKNQVASPGKSYFYRTGERESIAFRWLGQAGFLIKYHEVTFLIDPYLSDFLAKKYRNTKFPHIRMMPPPVKAEDLININYVFCTHGHSDHMDPESLQVISKNNPDCMFIVPAAEKQKALDRGITFNSILEVNANSRINLSGGININVIPSAHETLETNEKGEHLFLGYLITLGSVIIYHSGDCINYTGLAENLRMFEVDIAFLPVNGRKKHLSDNKIKGNFTFEEAAELCVSCGIRHLITHHFGMFDFNTVDITTLKMKAKRFANDKLTVTVPETSIMYSIKP